MWLKGHFFTVRGSICVGGGEAEAGFLLDGLKSWYQ